jgi:competence protein ComEC
LYWFDLILLSWTISVVQLFARLPFAEVEFRVDPRLIALFYAIVIGGALMRATQPAWALSLGHFIRRRAIVATTLFAGVAIFILTGAVALSRPDNNLHVWFLDVGSGNGVLVQTPRGAQMLVDGGSFPSRLLTAIGDRLPFNDSEIEVLAITQPDEFDIGALIAVLERYDIGVALTNGQPNLGTTYVQIEDMLAVHEVVSVRAGYTIETDDGVRLEVLHPQEQPLLDDSLDDNALVLRLSYGTISFLLTGDLSQDGQAALLEAGEWPLASVMQLPQHGIARSLDTSFLEAAQPQVIVIQTDLANRRGEANPDVLALLGDLPIYRTDEGDTIHFWTDGRELWVINNT